MSERACCELYTIRDRHDNEPRTKNSRGISLPYITIYRARISSNYNSEISSKLNYNSLASVRRRPRPDFNSRRNFDSRELGPNLKPRVLSSFSI